MIGITELPPSSDYLRRILDMLRDNGAYITIPKKNYKKMCTQYNKLLKIKSNPLVNEFFMIRSIPIYKGELK